MEQYLPNVFYWKRTWTWEKSVEDVIKNEKFLKKNYKKHIAYIKVQSNFNPAGRKLQPKCCNSVFQSAKDQRGSPLGSFQSKN